MSGFLSVAAMSAGVFSQESIFHNFTWIARGGLKHGSIVGRNQVDGMSGATKTLWSVSAGTEFKVKGHYVETGLNIGKTDQHVHYESLVVGRDIIAIGNRDMSLLLLDIPLLYNFHFFPSKTADAQSSRLVAGVGPFASIVLSKRMSSEGTLRSPEKMSDWALGPFFRLSYFPLEFRRLTPGFYFDFYRSFLPKSFYDNAYFKQNGLAGQLGTMNFGVSFRY
jgi:hypothetical protein